MKIKRLSVALLLGAGLVGSATAAGLSAAPSNPHGLTVSGDVHASTAYQYRGKQFSDGEPSMGASITAKHTSGLYGTLQTDTIKLTDGSSQHQLQSAVTLGYDYVLPHDVTVGGGLTRNIFSGRQHVSDLGFSEAFLGASWNGLSAKVSTVVESAKVLTPGFEQGDTYAELAYTYQYGKYSAGAAVGYQWFDGVHAGATDGLALAQVHVGYAFNDQVSVKLSHQFAGHDAYGQPASGRSKTWATLAYRF